MTTTMMTVISRTMTTTGAAMTAAFGDSGVFCKLCIRSALNIDKTNYTDSVYNVPIFLPLYSHSQCSLHVNKLDKELNKKDIHVYQTAYSVFIQ